MRVKGDNLKSLYRTFSDIYRSRVGSSFKWKSGEKGRVKKLFTYCSEAMGLRDEKDFKAALKMLASYLEQKSDEWLQWDHRSRGNYIGFLSKKEEIEVFVSGELSEGPEFSKELQIAGTATDDEWDF